MHDSVFRKLGFLWAAPALLSASAALGLELDWSGQFRSEFDYIHNYTLDGTDAGSTFDPARYGGNGYYIPSGGSNNATFETLFLRLKPKLVVNDNIYVKSEWWVGDPVYSFFGSAAPYTADQRQWYSTQSRGSVITAQRFWVELLSDVGTFQVGRAPLNYGLGVVWNSGDDLWSRYMSTGDMIRLLSKFGSFTVSPAFIVYSTGNTIGGAGAFNPAYTASVGSGGVADYSFMLKYENPEEDFEVGVNLIRRIGGASQDVLAGPPVGATPLGMSFNTWDLYGKKKVGKLTLVGEAPIITGTIGSSDFNSFALVGEADYRFSETWGAGLKAGHVPGQPNSTAASTPEFRSAYLNPNYRVGLIMFPYQLANFWGPNTLNNNNATAAGLRSDRKSVV
jgi:hypothetical protein